MQILTVIWVLNANFKVKLRKVFEKSFIKKLNGKSNSSLINMVSKVIIYEFNNCVSSKVYVFTNSKSLCVHEFYNYMSSKVFNNCASFIQSFNRRSLC